MFDCGMGWAEMSGIAFPLLAQRAREKWVPATMHLDVFMALAVAVKGASVSTAR